MKNIPKKIYLNLGFDKEEIDIKDIDDFEELVGVSWSDTKINDQDIEYILSERQENTETIEQHDSEALHIADVVRSLNLKESQIVDIRELCTHKKTPVFDGNGNAIGNYCDECGIFFNNNAIGIKC